ncbi:MAG: aldehyde dehydrogenase [Candidatus Thorarchaeota archaeon]
MTNFPEIGSIVNKQHKFFNSGTTKDVTFRISQLNILKSILEKHQSEILSAVQKDLKKPEYEAYITEIGGTLLELKYALKNIKKWIKPRKVRAPISQFKGSGKIYPEPLGVSLIISPWNYPFNLILTPLIGAISAGNCAILKPSELAPSSSETITSIINSNFEAEYIYSVEGDAETVKKLLENKFDHIFFTGSSRVGKIIMESASKNLTPVTLELGGKSPCIVDEPNHLNFENISDYIASAKFINCGSTCIAVDYILVHNASKDRLTESLKNSITKFYGTEIAKSPDYARIINKTHFDRLTSYLTDGKIVFGGDIEPNNRYFGPTILDMEIDESDKKIMHEEIFGPILPIISYDSIDQAIAYINSKPKPLALYFFSNNKINQNKIIKEVSFGGGTINDTFVHPSLPNLPFGGVGDSGIGAYHGKYSFETFSHMKSVFYRSTRFDFTKNFRVPPYKNKLKLVKRFLR